jgi:hypothetical protein
VAGRIDRAPVGYPLLTADDRHCRRVWPASGPPGVQMGHTSTWLGFCVRAGFQAMEGRRRRPLSPWACGHGLALAVTLAAEGFAHVALCLAAADLNPTRFFAGDGGHPGQDGLVVFGMAGCLSPDFGVGRDHGNVGGRRGTGETSDECVDPGDGQFVEAGQRRFVVLSASVQQFTEDLVLIRPRCCRRGAWWRLVCRDGWVGEGHVRGCLLTLPTRRGSGGRCRLRRHQG